MDTSHEQLVARQKQQTVLVLLFSILLLVLLNAVSWWYLYRTRHILDDQFGDRLLVTGRAVLLGLDKARLENALLLDDEIARLLLQQDLEDRKKDFGLERILCTGIDHRVAVGTENILLGEPITACIRTGPGIPDSVAAGTARATALYRIADSYFKAALLPVRDRFGSTIGLISVEASAAFLATIHQVRRWLFVGGSISAAVIVIFILLLGSSLRRLLSIQETLAENRRMALLGGLASRVTHEIRNPLGIIKSTADLIKKRYAPADNPPAEFDYINDEVRRLNGLITAFLSYAGEKPPNLKPVDIPALLQDQQNALKAECTGRGVLFILETAACPAVKADEDAVRQVLQNLVLNALEAVPEEGSITVTAVPGTMNGIRGCLVSVADNGPGINGEVREKLFTPFFTTKTAGTGLGLAICRKLIDQHRGSITVENRPEGGAVFRIVLPAG